MSTGKREPVDVGEEQRRAAGFYDAVRDFGDLEPRANPLGHDVEFACVSQRLHEGAQRGEWHERDTYALERRSPL